MIRCCWKFARAFMVILAFQQCAGVAIGQSLLSYGGGRYGAGTTLFRDYQAAGINPANLGIFEPATTFTFAFLEEDGRVHSDAIPKSDLISSLLHGKKLNTEEKIEMGQLFAENGLSFNDDLMIVGFALQIPKGGGLAFTWKEKVTGNTILNPAFSDLAFNGLNSKYIDSIVYDAFGVAIGLLDTLQTFSDYFNGTTLQFNWRREFNISYGRQIVKLSDFKIYGGLGIKFLRGNGIADINYSNNTASGFAAFSPLFNIDYADITQPGVELKGDFTPVGKGFAVDFGGTLTYKDKIFAGISVTDLGSMKWTGNLVKLNDGIFDSLVNFAGIESANIYSELESLLNANGLFQWSETSEIKQTLPAELRIGGAIRFSEKLEAGIDLIQPFNKNPGSSQRTTITGIVTVAPIKAIKISTGFIAGGIVDIDVPLGIAFSFVPQQAWQLSFGTSDIISLLKQDRPTVSLSVSLFRFKM